MREEEQRDQQIASDVSAHERFIDERHAEHVAARHHEEVRGVQRADQQQSKASAAIGLLDHVDHVIDQVVQRPVAFPRVERFSFGRLFRVLPESPLSLGFSVGLLTFGKALHGGSLYRLTLPPGDLWRVHVASRVT